MIKKIKTAYLISFVLVFSLSSLYIYQIINYTKETYLIQCYQREVENINRGVLSYTSFASPSLNRVEKIAREMEFRQAERVSYIEVLGREVVSR